MKVQILVTSAILFFASLALAVPQYNFQPDAGKIEFKTKGWPSLITIKGEGTGVTGALTETDGKVSGDLTFELKTLKTGIDLRDNHMKDKYLEVGKYPTAKLKLTNISVPQGLSGDLKIKGLLELHGQSKEVAISGKLEQDGETLKLKGEIPITLTDFKIPIPNYKGITVAELVTVSFSSKVQQIK